MYDIMLQSPKVTLTTTKLRQVQKIGDGVLMISSSFMCAESAVSNLTMK